MKRIFILCSILCCAATQTDAYATNIFSSGKAYIGAGGGELFPTTTTTTNSTATGPGWPNDTYTNRRTLSDEPYFFVDGGYTWKRKSNWLPYYSIGARYSYAAPMTVSGNIDQYSVPGFTNYGYQYSIQQQSILAILKADLFRWKKIMPYVTGGAGLAINNAFNYKEQAYSGVTPRVSPGYQSNATTNFSYILGGGFDVILTKKLWLNLEYNYANYGTVKTGYGADTSTLTGYNYSGCLLKNKLRANTALLGLTYYLG